MKEFKYKCPICRQAPKFQFSEAGGKEWNVWSHKKCQFFYQNNLLDKKIISTYWSTPTVEFDRHHGVCYFRLKPITSIEWIQMPSEMIEFTDIESFNEFFLNYKLL